VNEFLKLSALAQARLVRERKISPAELVRAHLEHIAKINPVLNAAVEVLAGSALAEARAVPGGAPGLFAGVPFSVKDSIEVAGSVCTAGTVGRAGAAPSTADAVLVRRLREAGAIPIARTNLPDLLFAFESDNLLFGATNNPYGLARTSGGSSGGEAALIAACGSPMGLGSDAAGSVRLPAAFCGIAGLKPTSGRLPREGHFPPAGGWIEALWQIGPMARYVEDLRAMMEAFGAGSPRPDRRPLRVAFHTDNGIAAADADVERIVRAAARALEPQVAVVAEDWPRCLETAYDLEMNLIGPDGGDALRQYAAELGSTRLHPLLTGWLDKLERHRTDLAGFQGYWAGWDRYRAEMRAFLRRYDAIVCPAYIHAALPHGTSTREENFRGFSHTMAYNVAGWPAAVVRCGETAEGLPIAVQVAAGWGREDVALEIAAALEEALGGWKPPAFPTA
jgi:amidase